MIKFMKEVEEFSFIGGTGFYFPVFFFFAFTKERLEGVLYRTLSRKLDQHYNLK